MFPWRKRDQGFEWREYVRTTILVRRRERRQKIEDVRAAAVVGVKQAGRSGASAAAAGASSVARGTWSFLSWLGPVSKRLAQRTGAGLGFGASRAGGAILQASKTGAAGIGIGLAALTEATGRGLWHAAAVLGPLFAHAGKLAWHAVAPLFAFLRQPTIQLPLALMSAAAGISAFFGILTHGFDGQNMTALAIALGGGALLVAPRLAANRERESRRAGEYLGNAGRALYRALGLHRLEARHAGALALLLVVVLLAGGGWYAMSDANITTGSIASGEPEAPAHNSDSTLEGRAVAVTGDTLRIANATVALDGIEAPERDQQCDRDGKSWRCGEAAKDALARLVRGKRVTCELSGTRDDGARTASCNVRGADIAEALVRNGHVFAEHGLFSRYVYLQSEAKTARAGLWAGDADRPSDYRAKRWEEARRAAPEGCPIKGRVSSGARVYVLPWSGGYDSVRVVSARGERWFCSEAEAQAAGWRPLSPSS